MLSAGIIRPSQLPCAAKSGYGKDKPLRVCGSYIPLNKLLKYSKNNMVSEYGGVTPDSCYRNILYETRPQVPLKETSKPLTTSYGPD
ncbi:hypothetical protein GNI_063210 [Gregarina niphandrodes]|uniref:Uncharacterized protein n=1 Tax=Gregarina niphandrodes TaxID=110365 RepID=A0A023B8A5_GRENI|nr:hypothetical protein GNI_063210 [Gregarina niphandrodes]EZG68229.1 hypothetical protein GNI_063210 [Gregarina niphandrodes]|eukprot:XP_011130031.1 hypothetical protein GNI_063210 [Gregarina niphandrodes]